MEIFIKRVLEKPSVERGGIAAVSTRQSQSNKSRLVLSFNVLASRRETVSPRAFV